MSFTRTLALTRATQRMTATRSATRSYSQMPKEPINMERGSSKTPFYIGGALLVLGGGYLLGTKGTPNTPAVQNMKEATHGSTPGARAAAGQGEDPHARPSVAGGDQKAKK